MTPYAHLASLLVVSLLHGCMAADAVVGVAGAAVSTAVGVAGTVVETTADVITAPLRDDDEDP